MNSRSFSLRFLFAFLSTGSAFAQNSLQVSEAQLTNHLAQSVEPVYSQTAGLQGKVIVRLTVTPEGKVIDVKTVSGPHILQQSAMDAIRQWQFRPFKSDGQLVAASGEVSIDFFPGREEVVKRDTEIFTRYSAQDKLCFDATVRVGRDYSDTVAPCLKAAEIANEFNPNMHFFERSISNVNAAWELENTQNPNGALVYANRAVAVVQQGHSDDFTNASAYQVRGEIRASLRDLKDAEQDFSTAIDYESKALKLAKKQKTSTVDNLQSTLEHLRKRRTELLVTD